MRLTGGLLALVGFHRRLWPLHGLLAFLGAWIFVSGLLDSSPLQLGLGAVLGLASGFVTALDLAQPRTALPVPVRTGLAVVLAILLIAALLLAALG